MTTPDTSKMQILTGDGTWPFKAYIDGDDVCLFNVRMTCFGGIDDPQDNGETASGRSTRNPATEGFSLPMDGRMFRSLSRLERQALNGSPIPKVPWFTELWVSDGNITVTGPLLDLGPGKRTGNAIDATVASARCFNARATAKNFEARVHVRIKGAAKYVTPLQIGDA